MNILDLIKLLPMTNCKACGYDTCMAFASHVIKKGAPLSACPHLPADVFDTLDKTLKEQQAKKTHLAPDRFKTAKEFVTGKIQDYDFAELAPYLGGEYIKRDGKDTMILPYLGHRYEISKQEARALDDVPEHDVWDTILLYNYIASNCRKSPTGNWISIDALPGSIPKKPELEETCEKRIARAFTGNVAGLKTAVQKIGGAFADLETSADLKAVIHPLPKTPFLLLFWDEDAREGFEARAKVLFDETILCFLDIESAVFLAEKMASRLIEMKG